MSAFTEKELAYMETQHLGRLATLTKGGAPHLSPVGFRYNRDLDTIDIGGRDLPATVKWREIVLDNRVSFVIDDVLPPWKPRGIEIRGRAETIEGVTLRQNAGFGPGIIRIKPQRILGWGLDENASNRPNSRNVDKT